MHALSAVISTNTAGRPASRTECQAMLTSDSEIEGRIIVRGTIPGGWDARGNTVAGMRVWIDLTNSPHVLVMQPVIEVLRTEGHGVRVTARDFAQTLALCERLGIEHTAIGHQRGERLGAKAVGLASRSTALVRWARREACAADGRGFDLALGHGSNDVSVAAALLRVPSSTMFDYEWATVQHNLNCRLARAVVVPEAIPP